ncbi:hypothetical protein LCL61_17630 [Amycolatopsis coloradensis]|uniref:Uncharacterized protein n=1 Tax=Amycolatopsis coloradensis TaxID=76021 RepID=A0ACD5BDA5_9PSEU
MALRIKEFPRRPAGGERETVTVDLDVSESGGIRPVSRHTIQDVLLGHITWEELTVAAAPRLRASRIAESA